MSILSSEALYTLTLDSIRKGVEKVFHVLKLNDRVSHPHSQWLMKQLLNIMAWTMRRRIG